MISVILPTYGRSDYLKRAIDSVLNQTYQNLELIIVDDNDPESFYRKEVESIVTTIPDDRVQYIQHDRNLNGAAARNTGINASSGDFVAFLDDDDVWHLDKLERQLLEFDKSKEVFGVYCLASKCSKGERYYNTSYLKEGELSIDLLSLNSEIFTPSLIFKKEVFEVVGLFDVNFIRHQDFEFLLRYFENYDIFCCKENLLDVHVDDRSILPELNSLIDNKHLFLHMFKEKIASLSRKEQRRIKQSHYYEIVYWSLRNYNLKFFLLYLWQVFPYCLFDKVLLKKVIRKSTLFLK
ncbi:glycosyltransferase family 2 protein [Vibrio coralliirubri]|uniref:glycosyltransferase family 2 protein n=1 Tax=Vibrio coralliirubri TaxID=1516159 RepID=UPI00063243F3|nr:glycosyltransferase family A protein [Vibrio coralliirubri]CDT94047.1 putative Glycosyl transferase [Vibrio coralliirubri]